MQEEHNCITVKKNKFVTLTLQIIQVHVAIRRLLESFCDKKNNNEHKRALATVVQLTDIILLWLSLLRETQYW